MREQVQLGAGSVGSSSPASAGEDDDALGSDPEDEDESDDGSPGGGRRLLWWERPAAGPVARPPVAARAVPPPVRPSTLCEGKFHLTDLVLDARGCWTWAVSGRGTVPTVGDVVVARRRTGSTWLVRVARVLHVDGTSWTVQPTDTPPEPFYGPPHGGEKTR